MPRMVRYVPLYNTGCLQRSALEGGPGGGRCISAHTRFCVSRFLSFAPSPTYLTYLL